MEGYKAVIHQELDTFDKRFDAVVDHAKKALRLGMERISTMHAHDASGQTYIIPITFNGTMSTTDFCEMCRQLFKEKAIVEYQFHSVSWAVDRPGTTQDKWQLADELRGRIHEQPDKKEILMILGVQVVGDEIIKKSRAFRIERNPQDEIIALIEMTAYRDCMQEGQFAEPLDPFPSGI